MLRPGLEPGLNAEPDSRTCRRTKQRKQHGASEQHGAAALVLAKAHWRVRPPARLIMASHCDPDTTVIRLGPPAPPGKNSVRHIDSEPQGLSEFFHGARGGPGEQVKFI